MHVCRRFRELKQSGTDLKKDPAAPYRLELNVPLPVSKGSGRSILCPKVFDWRAH